MAHRVRSPRRCFPPNRSPTDGSEPESRRVGPVPELDPGAIVRALNRHGVRYVIIGGIAVHLHDLPVPATVDIAFTPDGAPRE